jgi:predicted dehydrogenase
VRLLIVGLGSIGSRHLRTARAVASDAELAVLRRRCEGVPEGAVACFTDLGEALAFGPRAAVIATPATRHLEAALPLAEAGVHLLVEKPIADGPDGVADLVRLCERRGVTLMTGYNLRFTPALRRLRARLDEGVVGRVLSVRAEVGQYLPTWRPGRDYRDGVSARRDLGGGVLLELSHEIDYVRWLFGEVRRVQAVVRRQSDLEIDVEDTAHLLLGIDSRHDVGHEIVANVSLDFIRHDATRRCTVIGETGTLRWTHAGGLVEHYPAGGGWRELDRVAPGPDAGYTAEWEHFLECVRDGGRPLVDGADGLAVLAVVDAARRAAASRREETVKGVTA